MIIGNKVTLEEAKKLVEEFNGKGFFAKHYSVGRINMNNMYVDSLKGVGSIPKEAFISIEELAEEIKQIENGE